MTFRKMMKVLLPLLGVASILALLMQIHLSRAAGQESSTPQAPQPAGIRAEGSVVSYPGASVTVSTEIPGTLAELRVEEKSEVRKGDVIAVLAATEQRAALAEARARVSEERAEVHRFMADLRRNQTLHESGVVTRQTLEHAQRDLESAQARWSAAHAQVRRLETVLTKSRIVAPINGVVISQLVHQGEFVTGGTPLVVVADLTRSRVEAEVDEFDTGKVVLGAPVRIMAEGFPGTSWMGTVEDIPNAVVDRRLKPQDPGRPVDPRVLRVKISLDEPTPLKLGQRVELELTPSQAQSQTKGSLDLTPTPQ